VVRERSAKPLCVGSIPTRASNSSKPILSSASFDLPKARKLIESPAALWQVQLALEKMRERPVGEMRGSEST
jgi:hypothetical protein